MKTIVCVFPLALTLTAAQAQDAPCGQWNPERIKWDGCPDRVWDKQFTAYTAALWAATVLDVETTRSALDNCVGCQEGNPMFGDDPSRGRIYAVMAPINVGVMWLSYRMKKRGSKWWMMPMLAPTTGHGIAASLNLRF